MSADRIPSAFLALLQSQTSLDRLVLAALDLVLQETGAARAFLMIRAESGEISVKSGRSYEGKDLDTSEFPGSRTIANSVLEKKQALFIPSLPSEATFAEAPSVRASGLQSVICIPLFLSGGDLLGLLYVDSTTPVRPLLTEDHLQLLQGMANHLAISIENARLFEEIQAKNRRIKELNQQLEQRVEAQEGKLIEIESLLEESQRELGKRSGLGDIIGVSPAMQNVFRIVEKVSQTNATVLIQGESGSGKELLARHIHFHSPRAKRPIVSVNCAAYNDTLLESELFGHRKGAFTGAEHPRLGVFQLADGGTLFLDEVGDMSLEMQKKLLRALQNGEIRPLGSDTVHHVDVRVIAASNRDLKDLAAEGKFREDLYYRLNVIEVKVPALRDRAQDIPVLIDHFIRRIAAELGRPPVEIPGQILERFLQYRWPGNVRELENEIRRFYILESDYRTDHLTSPESASQTSYDLNAIERNVIRKALEAAQGNKTRAAELLGLPLRTLYDRLKKHGLSSD